MILGFQRGRGGIFVHTWSHQHSEKLGNWCSRLYSRNSNMTLIIIHIHQSRIISVWGEQKERLSRRRNVVVWEEVSEIPQKCCCPFVTKRIHPLSSCVFTQSSLTICIFVSWQWVFIRVDLALNHYYQPVLSTRKNKSSAMMPFWSHPSCHQTLYSTPLSLKSTRQWQQQNYMYAFLCVNIHTAIVITSADWLVIEKKDIILYPSLRIWKMSS